MASAALGVFAVALALRLLHVFSLRSSPFFDVLLGDARGYDEWARRIAGGDWIGTEVFYQAPLYPYFLGVLYAVAGPQLLFVRLAQALVGATSCALLALAGARFFGSRRVGVAAGLGLALYAPAIFFDGLVQKSVLDTCFVALSLWIMAVLVDAPERWRLWLGLGIVTGLLSLTRENALVLLVVLGAWALWTGRSATRRAVAVRAVSGFLAGAALVLIPVAARNAAVGGGVFITTSQFGPNLFIGNNPNADGTYMSLRFGRGAPEYERQDATELAELALARRLTPGEVSSYWTTRALDFVTGQPGAWLRLTARKVLLLINQHEMLDTESQESYAEYSIVLRILGAVGHFGWLVPLAALGIGISGHHRRLAIAYVVLATYALSVVAFYVFARYRLPLVPFLQLPAAAGLVQLFDILRASVESRAARLATRIGSRRRLALTACAVMGLIVATRIPLLSPTLMRAITENNLATALHASGRIAEATRHFDRAASVAPDYAPSYNNKGVMLNALGRTDEAIASYQRALAVAGNYPDAHYNLANALLIKGQPQQAAEHFEIALKSIPDSAGIRNNLGIALAAQGRGEDALASFRAAVEAAPRSAVAHRNLGDALAELGRVDEAVAALRRAAELDPQDFAAPYNLGIVLLEAQRFDESARALRLALMVKPGSADALNNLGIALASQGQLDAAIAQFRQALVADPSFQDAQRNLTQALGASRASATAR